MPIDKVMLGVLNAYFRAAAEAAGHTLKRSAHTTYVKESNDFTTGLLTLRGEQFCYPVALAAQTYVGIRFISLLKQFEPWSEGDIGVTNCPYLSKGVATHLPDYHMVKPIFWKDRLISVAWCFIHSSDMGGMVAGSIQPSAYELFQEGIRIPPKKLYRAGVLQDDVKDFMLVNVRQPDKNWGDLNAMMACLGTAEQRVHEAVRKWGVEMVLAGSEALVDYAEARARSLIDRLPNAEWNFHDYLEDDVVSDMPIRVKVRVTKSTGGNLHLDYSGSDPQVGAAFNIASNGHHPFLCGGILGYLRTMDPSIPINGGLLRPIQITAPEGSVLNATFPAACGVRFAITQLNYGVLQAVLAQALPNEVPAAGAAQGTIIAVSINDRVTGRRRASVIQPMIGGSGARPASDGIDGTDFSLGALANTPTESLEREVAVLVRHYGMIPNSGGAGRYRGGLAARLDFEVLQPDTILTARGMDRFKFQPWGLNGGRAGAKGDCWLNPGQDRAKHLGKIDVIRLNLGEVFSVRTPGGGGYGDPLDRPPTEVLTDVQNGLATVEAAKQEYGVVIVNNLLDRGATEKLRTQRHAAMAKKPPRAPGQWPDNFDGGENRMTYERTFTPQVSDTLSELLYTAPVAARYFAKQEMFSRIRQLAAKGGAVTPQSVRNLWIDTMPALGLKPKSQSAGAPGRGRAAAVAAK